MRLKDAAKRLNRSRSTIRNMIAREELKASQPKPGTTSPIYVYCKQVDEIAEAWGLL